MSHKAADVARYRDKMHASSKESRAILSFVQEFHGAGALEDMFKEAKKAPLSETRRRTAEELEKHPEALCLLQVASRTFRLSMPTILRKQSTSTKKVKVVRDVLAYVMHKDLEMSCEDICIFLGLRYEPVVTEAINYISEVFLEDEDIILAVDLVRKEYNRMVEQS